MTFDAVVRTHTGRLAHQRMTLGSTVLDADGDALDGPGAWGETRPLGGGGLRWGEWVRVVCVAVRVARVGEA